MPISPLQFQEMEARLAQNRHKLPSCKTRAEIDAAIDETGEGLLHDQIIAECKRRFWPYVHSRMDRATTTAVGVVDFVIAADNGRVFWIECKAGKKTLSQAQQGFAAMLRRNGHEPLEVRSYRQFLTILSVRQAEHSRHD